ncbi:hypothetical protein ACRRTK_007110 [Alexandromys fortis]
MWLLGIELRTFGRAGNALNPSAISLAPEGYFEMTCFLLPSFLPLLSESQAEPHLSSPPLLLLTLHLWSRHSVPACAFETHQSIKL